METPNLPNTTRALSALRCIHCGGKLEIVSGPNLRCVSCHRTFAIDDDLPILLDSVNPDSLRMKRLYDETEFKADPRKEQKGLQRIGGDHSIKKIMDALLDFARLAKTERVLEIGCGMGQLTEILCDQAREVYTFDLSHFNSQYTLRHRTRDNAIVFMGDAIKIPLPDSFFDCVVASEVIEHVPDPHRMIEEMKRVVRTGGRICVSTPNPYVIVYPHWGIPSLVLHPIRTVRRLRGKESWSAIMPDYWIAPHTLAKWFREHRLKVLRHKTFMYFSWRGVLWFVFLFLERVLKLNVERMFAAYLRVTDSLIDSGLPLVRLLGTRQVILAEKI